MKTRNIILSLLIALSVITILTWLRGSAKSNDVAVRPDGGGEFKFQNTECLTDEKRAEIKRENDRNIAMLRAQGKLPDMDRAQVVALNWPTRPAATINDFDIYGISNFVDQNPNFPNQLLDWNCGARTYDTAGGYNHAGIDIFTWPFGWYKMDNNQAEIVAAAPGVIINKFDGNFDRSCATAGGNWNAVYVRHADNSVAWYGHMKKNSQTTKNIGDAVAQGEFLGIIGSSGNSTGPHLHFELYNAAGALQDPYLGTCNAMNNFTWWTSQRPYNDTRVNALMTHSAPPVFPGCPTQEQPNTRNIFTPGSTVITAMYLRDQLVGQQAQLTIIQPNGSPWQTWNFNSNNNYAASYWYWNWTLPPTAQLGNWTFRVTYNAQTAVQHTFFVRPRLTVTPFDFDGDGKTDVGVFRPQTGAWYYLRSSSNTLGSQAFGLSTDMIAPADYDGDGKTDVAVFRPSSGSWYLQRSTAGFTGIAFGTNGDVPVPADYDGDGTADVAVFRPSTGIWYMQRSTAGFLAIQFGQNGDIPVPSDYDGDGRADVSVYRDAVGAWYLNRSTAGFTGIAFGSSGDKPVAGDYDGDSKADVAVFRPSTDTWFVLGTTAGFSGFQFGAAGDIPAPGDYDGDARYDHGVFRPVGGNWYMQRSTAGFTGVQFGSNGDVPIPSAFIP
jgi:murein DD-endopeptidase MepM/ murein hydrolase activator NlpD